MEENDENYFSLIDIYTCTMDIIVSVCDFAVATKQFFIDLWIEFYVQLTTISWLSVRNVQRSNKTIFPIRKAESSSETIEDFKIFGLFDQIRSLGSMFSMGGEDEEIEMLTERDLLTKAEERVRLANEMVVNNTQARARLAMTDIIRKSALDNVTQEVSGEDSRQTEFSIFNYVLYWIVDEKEESEDISIEEPLDEILEEKYNSEDIGFFEIPEEEHLELFYIASFLFLSFLIVIIFKRNLNYSKKKALFLSNIKKIKLQQELTNLSTENPGFMRLNSYH